jgi:hypothetical protein
MSANRTLGGPKPVEYFEKPWHRLDWVPLPVKAPYREYWEIWYKGKHVGEYFIGKSGRSFGIVFNRFTIYKGKHEDLLLVLTSTICGPRV